MIAFNASNWYWSVTGIAGQVYSSALGDYVPTNNATYVAWLGSGGITSKSDSEASLGIVLANAGVLRPVAAGVLDGYKGGQATNIVATTVFKVLFNHENRLRAIERALSLNGSPADLTAGQAVAAVKALM